MGCRTDRLFQRVCSGHAGGSLAARGSHRHVARRHGRQGAPSRGGQEAVRQQDETRHGDPELKTGLVLRI